MARDIDDAIGDRLLLPVQEEESSGLLTFAIETIKGLADRLDGRAILDELKPLLAKFGEEEWAKLSSPLYDILKTGEAFDSFKASIPRKNTGPLFTPLSLADLLAMPPKEWLIDQVIGAQDMVMVYGPPGSGKTFLVIDLVFAACLGSQWATRFDVSRPLTVAYCAGEGVSGLPARFAAAAEFHGVSSSSLPNFHFYKTIPQLYHKEGRDTFPPADHVRRFVADWLARDGGPLDLLVIDTLHAASVGAEENSASDMGLVLQAVRHASNDLGCAVLLVHHTNKGGSAERGSSALRGAMDAMISVKKISEETTSSKGAVTCEKLKDGEGWKPQTFDLVSLADSVRVWWDEPAEIGQGQGKQGQDKAALLSCLLYTSDAADE